MLVSAPARCVPLSAHAQLLRSLSAKGQRVVCFSCSSSSPGKYEKSSSTGKEVEGREVSYTLVLSGDFQNCLQELHIMNHSFFWSCVFLSRKMNQCCSNQVSSCTEVWQMRGDYLESWAVHCVHLACTWERSLESLVAFFERLLSVFCEVTLCSLLKNINY